MTTATLLTVPQLREHVETDLPDTALARFLDANEGEMIRLFGAHATATEQLRGGVSDLVLLSRPAASIASVTEVLGLVSTALAADDYTLWHGSILTRLYTGTHSRGYWGDAVTVVYVPQDLTAQRTAVLVKLCQLDIAYNGLKQEAVGSGDYSATSQDYVTERARLLRTLAPRGGWFCA